MPRQQMSSFCPTRASPSNSPAPKPILKTQLLDSLDISSNTSSTSFAALAGLSSEDVSLIDDIIERAPSTATTFLTVFKAYNEILQERGLDSGDDVIYYRMLLKLGVVKGKDWGDKWRAVKSQLGYGVSSSSIHPKLSRPLKDGQANYLRQSLVPVGRPHHDIDSFTIHSHQDATENTDTEVESLQHAASVASDPEEDFVSETSTTNALGLHIEPTPCPPLPTIAQFLPLHSSKWQVGPRGLPSAPTEKTLPLSPTPPSYHAATRTTQPPFSPGIKMTREAAHLVKSQHHERKASTINEAEAWEKIKTVRDEKEADQFRRERILERCWHVWREGIQWINVTSQQVDMARNNLVLRTHTQKWRSRLAALIESNCRVANLADSRLLKFMWSVWRKRLRAKKLTEWRDGMRKRMMLMKGKRDGRMKEDAWTKWRQLYQIQLSGSHYSQKLRVKMFIRWKIRLGKVDRIDTLGDGFIRARDQAIQSRCWELWSKYVHLRGKERQISSVVGIRLKGEAIEVWKLRMQEHHRADECYDFILLKRFLYLWKKALSRVHLLKHKADKYYARREAILVQAVMGVWIAHERGMLLERVRTARMIQDAWTMWKKRQQDLILLQDRAIAFTTRATSSLLNASLKHWRQVQLTHDNAYRFAVQYRDDQLRYLLLNSWRVKLRLKLKMSKQARLARRYLLARSMWNVWKDRMEERRRENKAKALEVKMLDKSFQRWRENAARQQYQRYATQKVERMVTLHILGNALKTWTTRVIELKLREFDTVDRRNQGILSTSFGKWKSIRSRHAEDLSLMQSYQDIKREETMRRMLHRWLSAMRKARHRRITLQRGEKKVNNGFLAAAWDKWRERLQDERLRPLEYGISIQFEKNLLFRAFGGWYSRTKSGPAIRFHATHVKARFWTIWRNAMPKALQAKKARNLDRNSTLARALDKWVKTYRTKIALKAVARARYLRLPSALSKPNQPVPSALSTISRASVHSAVSSKSVGSASPDNREYPRREMEGTVATEAIRPPGRRPLTLTERPVSSIPLEPSRQTSGNHNGNHKGRTSLWTELREAQKRSRAGSERSRSVGSR